MKGGLLAASSAFAYGVTVVIGRHLASSGLGSAEILGVRFAIAAGFIFGLVLVLRRPLMPARGERLIAFLVGAVGYAGQATLFYLALSKGTAGAVALLFYAYPAMVTVGESITSRTLPTARAIAAVILSAMGAAIIVSTGGRLEISRSGIVLSLAAAAAFAAYLLAGDRLLHRTHSATVSAWVALGAAIALLVRAMTTGGIQVPAKEAPLLVLYGASTGVAFVCMFAALRLIGSQRTAVVMTLEALFAVLLGALFLSETIGIRTAIGGLAILAGAILATTASPSASQTESVVSAP
jgi:drug/metabolite transporter (DMT)-like permease